LKTEIGRFKLKKAQIENKFVAAANKINSFNATPPAPKQAVPVAPKPSHQNVTTPAAPTQQPKPAAIGPRSDTDLINEHDDASDKLKPNPNADYHKKDFGKY